MGTAFLARQARGQRRWPDPGADSDSLNADAVISVCRKFETSLVSTNELGINSSEQLAIEQCAMFIARGEVDAVSLAKRI
jgi:hypothetical protein